MEFTGTASGKGLQTEAVIPLDSDPAHGEPLAQGAGPPGVWPFSLSYATLPPRPLSESAMAEILLVMAGGSIGALSRYGAGVLAVRLFGVRFPWGTLAVNLAGCFLIGFAFSLAERHSPLMNPSARLFFVTGYLGALTTFSTFALETVGAAQTKPFLLVALPNLLANNLLGMALVLLGMWAGRLR